MRLATLLSGGKDSNYALYYMLQQGAEICCVVNVIPEREDSWMFHVPNTYWVRLQAKSMGISLIQGRTKGIKEEELDDMKKLLEKVIEKYEIDGVVYGAIASEYQRSRVERVCDELGLRSYAPLWGKDPLLILKEIVKSGFKVLIIGVYALGLTRKHLGRIIDENMIKELARLQDLYEIHPAGEGGEFETFVLDAPHYKQSIKITKYRTLWHFDKGELIIEKAELCPKRYHNL